MRKLLNTLYVTSPDSYLIKEGENVVILVENEKKLQLPIHTIENIISFGYSGASPALMNFCAEKGVGLSFHTENGKFLARAQGPVHGNVLLRKKQYKSSDDELFCLNISKNIIIAKLLNSRNLVQRTSRERDDEDVVTRLDIVSEKLRKSALWASEADNLDSLRGIEGDCAKNYFGVFDNMICQQKNDFKFQNRSKRPPTDYVNALLSFLYTVLAHDVQSALESVGLDPYVGFMHSDRPGRPSLALDLMEELRTVVADRLALSLINKKQVTKKDFVVKENGAVLLDKDSKKVVLQALFEKKKSEMIHPFLGEKIEVGLIPYVQSLLLARFLRGDLDTYPPFILK